jgi:hypothetical protein
LAAARSSSGLTDLTGAADLASAIGSPDYRARALAHVAMARERAAPG